MRKGFLVLLLLLIAVGVSLADTVVLIATNAGAGACLRSEPSGKTGATLATMGPKDVLTVTGEYGDYVLATAGDKTGYVWVKAIDANNVVTGVGARMVDKPSKAGNNVALLKAGTALANVKLLVTWYKVRVDGLDVPSWVYSDLVKRVPDAKK